MRRKGILAESRAVSKAMVALGDEPRLTPDALARLLKEATAATGNSPEKVERKLEHLGVIWLSTTLHWEPGIPSLCDFLVNSPTEEPEASRAD